MEERPGPWHPSPHVLSDVEARWPGRSASWDPAAALRLAVSAGFEPGEQLAGARFGVVVEGRLGGRPCVAKLSAEPDPSFSFRVASLLAEAGVGPLVHLGDAAAGLLLQDRVLPGTWLGSSVAEAPAADLGRLLAKLAQVRPPDLPTLESFLRPRLEHPLLGDRAPGALDPCEGERSAALGLLESLSGETRLLHGDATRGNVLSGTGRWWLVDPRGLLGDAAYDVAVAAWKSGWDPRATRTLVRSSGCDPDRVRAWARVAAAALV